MLRKTFLLIVFPFVVIVAAVFLTAHLFSAPAKFIIKNLDSEPVKVVAHWRDKTKNVGQISPNTMTEFFVEDETAIQFDITRSNGTAVSIGNIDFKSDVTILVEINRTSVDIKSDL